MFWYSYVYLLNLHWEKHKNLRKKGKSFIPSFHTELQKWTGQNYCAIFLTMTAIIYEQQNKVKHSAHFKFTIWYHNTDNLVYIKINALCCDACTVHATGSEFSLHFCLTLVKGWSVKKPRETSFCFSTECILLISYWRQAEYLSSNRWHYSYLHYSEPEMMFYWLCWTSRALITVSVPPPLVSSLCTGVIFMFFDWR